MSKTTDALQWAFDRGFNAGYSDGVRYDTKKDPLAGIADVPMPETPIAEEAPTFDMGLDVGREEGRVEQATISYADGWNAALAYAVQQLSEHFDVLVHAYHDGGKKFVMSLIEQRVDEVSK